MHLERDIRKDLDEALRGVDPTALGMVVRDGMIALADLGPAQLAAQLADQAALAVRSELAYAHRLIKVAVNGGWVTLEGDVDWNYQKNGAETAVRRERWVKGISNELHVHPRTDPADLYSSIDEAFRRQAELGSGAMVGSWAEREEPEQRAGADSA